VEKEEEEESITQRAGRGLGRFALRCEEFASVLICKPRHQMDPRVSKCLESTAAAAAAAAADPWQLVSINNTSPALAEGEGGPAQRSLAARADTTPIPSDCIRPQASSITAR
jgi:hypothetical protein